MLFTSNWSNIKQHLQHLIPLSIFPCMFMQDNVEKTVTDLSWCNI